MAATLRTLLDTARFHLRLVVPPADDAALDEPLAWAHSSDLPDPTPWLEPGQLLLTDGGYLRRHPGRDAADAYVERLAAASVRALGFATSVIHDEVPPALVDAARRRDFPLIEVADRTPFMAIIRHVADTIAADQRERLDWLLEAQRAIARAALRVDGLSAILHELEDRLDGWVALFDAAGERVAIPTERRIPEELRDVVDHAVRRALGAGTRRGGRISTAGGEVTLQTLGRRDRLRGVLAIGNAAPLDEAGSDLVASVIALASIALEQSRALEDARRSLRAGVLDLLLAGSVDVAARSAELLGSPLPAEPVRVVVAPAGGQRLLVEELELDAERGRGPFFALDADRLVLLVPDARLDALAAVLRRHRTIAGASGPAAWGELRAALAEAERAVAAVTDGESGALQRFDQLAGDGMIGLLARSGGREASRRLLEPLRDRPAADVDELLGAARVWLGHNGAWDPAAKELGIHRHTLRARMAGLGSAIGLDLDDFAGRAELWAALQLS
jgi:purine catabolism regulator